ncbi:MAG: GNAT family N-acetyltransferase [Pyramidobacter sp.]|nr:GNAT family N-acetyltransferase [Pyramidobacter sp.]
MNDLVIRVATESDAPALLNIYAPYVTETAITFEYNVPGCEEFAARIRATLARWPYLIAEKNGRAIGYAYAGSFHARPAYDWSVETSIYVERAARRRGLGRVLYDALETCLRAQGITNANACIAVPAAEPDPFLDRSSAAFHTRMGYRLAGEFSQCAAKFGRWYSMVWMEKHLLPHTPDPKPVKSFSDVRDAMSRMLANS